MKIIGVDFSGAKSDRNTWVAEGVLDGDTLKLDECAPKTRAELTEFLAGTAEPMVAAMDFPFSVPQAFAEFWQKESNKKFETMPDLWAAAAGMDYCDFQKLRDSFVKNHGEMMRCGDTNFGGPISPLKTGGPNMLPMTFYGMRTLHCLYESVNPRFRVPPLPLPKHGTDADSRILLEVMPGVLLRAFGLPAENYKTKNKTNGGYPQEVRRKILAGLKEKSGVSLEISDSLSNKCIDSHDCLDSLGAAVGAALWALDESQFLQPSQAEPPNEELKAACLEGWLYAPLPDRLRETISVTDA